MSDFRQEVENLLQSELDASQSEAREIARQAERFRRERGSTLSAEGIIDRMEKRVQETPTGKWNNLVAFLDADSYDIGDEENDDCEYTI